MIADAKQLTGLEKASVLVMSLGASELAEVFEHLSAEERDLLGAQIVKLQEIDAEVRESVLEEATLRQAQDARTDILSHADPELDSGMNSAAPPARRMLGRLRERADRLKVPVTTPSFASPEDLVRLPDEAIQAIIMRIPAIDISAALHAADIELQNAVLRNLPPQISLCVRRMLDTSEHPTISEIEAARQRIVQELRAVGLGREAAIG